MRRTGRLAFLLPGLLAASARPGRAADPPPAPGWYSTSGLSYVMAAGNSRASSLGVKAEVKRLWPKATFTFAAAGVRADANDPARRALYDHQPSHVVLPLFDDAGAPTGLTVVGRAATVDTTFTVSLVVSFAPRAATP